MTHENNFRVQFIKALGGLAAVLNEDISKERILAYYEMFKNQDHGAVLEAIDKAGLFCKFFPKPAELFELMGGGKGGGKDPAVAWQEVMKAVENIGPYANVVFEDGAIAAAILALGDWPTLCEMNYKELALQRIPARFAALYAEAVRRGQHQAEGKVYGVIDRDNSARGYESEGIFIEAKTIGEIMADARYSTTALLENKSHDAPAH